MPTDARGEAFLAARLGAAQEVATGAASATSAAFAGDTQMIRVVCTAACRIKIGSAPVAAAADPLLPANTVEYIAVSGGEQIAAIQEAAAGKLSITEIA